MTEYGVLLMDDTVAPCASLLQAVVYSRGADREVCERPPDGQWSIVAPAVYAKLRIDCLAPSHASLRRHNAAKERPCPACSAWESAYRRSLRRQRRQKATEEAA